MNDIKRDVRDMKKLLESSQKTRSSFTSSGLSKFKLNSPVFVSMHWCLVCLSVHMLIACLNFCYIYMRKAYNTAWRITCNMRQDTTFRADRPNRCGVMAVSRFYFLDGGRLPSWICFTRVWTTYEEYLVLFFHCAKFGWNRCSTFDNIHVFRYHEFGLKTLIHAPKMALFRVLPPKWGAIWTKPPKCTSLRESALCEPSCVKIRRRVWPVGEFPKRGRPINKTILVILHPFAQKPPVNGCAPNLVQM